jgi:hypothetical protein
MVLGGINCVPANKGVEDFLREQSAIRDMAAWNNLVVKNAADVET